MNSKPTYQQVFYSDYAVMAYTIMDGRYEVLVWRSFDEFWPHFRWLMESTPEACACVHCKMADDGALGVRGKEAAEDQKTDEAGEQSLAAKEVNEFEQPTYDSENG